MSEDITRTLKDEKLKRNWKNFLLGFIPLLVYVVTSVTESQITNMLFAPMEGISYFNAPFLYVWIKFFIQMFGWILSAILVVAGHRLTKNPLKIAHYLRNCENVSGAEGINARVVLRQYVPTSFAIFAMQVGFSLAIKHLAPSVAVAIFTSTVAFSYLLSVVFMKQRIYLVKLMFVVTSFSGVALIAYTNIAGSDTNGHNYIVNHTAVPESDTTMEGPVNQSYLGIISIIIAALCLAIHQILYARSFAREISQTLAQAMFVVSMMAAINVIVFWPLPLMLILTGVESCDLANLDWGSLVGSLLCAFVMALVYGYGLGITSPFFMALGELLNLTLNAVIDIFTKPNLVVSTYQIVGLVAVAVSFFVLILPDGLVSLPLRRQPKFPSNSANQSDKETKM